MSSHMFQKASTGTPQRSNREPAYAGHGLLKWLPGIVLLVAQPCWAETSSSLVDVVRRARSSTARVSVPTNKQLRSAEQLFKELLVGSSELPELQRRWRELDFELSQQNLRNDDVLWIVQEASDRRSGRGIYALRRHSGTRLVLQAPHGFFDRHTREIVAAMATHPTVSAASWNTVHRSRVDVAHEKRHYFNAFTRALLHDDQRPLVIQLHGFSRGTRRTQAGRTADFIVSNGSQIPTGVTGKSAKFLQAAFPEALTRIYPWQVQELGATTNVQGRLVREAGGEFVSIEVAPPLRQQFMDHPRDCDKFLKALVQAAE